jgi:hypothetical protein
LRIQNAGFSDRVKKRRMDPRQPFARFGLLEDWHYLEPNVRLVMADWGDVCTTIASTGASVAPLNIIATYTVTPPGSKEPITWYSYHDVTLIKGMMAGRSAEQMQLDTGPLHSVDMITVMAQSWARIIIWYANYRALDYADLGHAQDMMAYFVSNARPWNHHPHRSACCRDVRQI